MANNRLSMRKITESRGSDCKQVGCRSDDRLDILYVIVIYWYIKNCVEKKQNLLPPKSRRSVGCDVL